MITTPFKALAAATLALAALAAHAASETLAGRLDDTGNAALMAGNGPLAPADFSSPEAIANNVALYQVQFAQAGTLTISSTDYGSGGIDPYVSLFAGSDMSATFVASGIDDFSFSQAVTPGWYWVTIGSWVNESYAEQQGGTLGDGFFGLGQADLMGDGTYSVRVSLDSGTPPPPPVPEPSTTWLLGLGLSVLGVRAWRARRVS